MFRFSTPGRSGPGRAAWLAAAGALLLSVGTAGAQSQPTRPTHPSHFAITNARVVPVSGPVVSGGTVVVRDGIIQAVGTDVEVPADAWVLDAAGRTLYPGLIDAFGTLGHPESEDDAPELDHSWGPEDRPATFTWLTAADDLSEADERIRKWREAGFTSALSTRSFGLFPGRAAVINLAGDRGRAMVVEPSSAQRLNLQPRSYPGYPGALLGAFAYVKQLYSDAEHYDRVWTAYETDPRGSPRPEYDRALEPLRGRTPLLFPATDRKEIARAISTAQEIGTPLIVYGGQEAYEAVDLLEGANVPVLLDLDWPEQADDADPEAEPDLRTLRSWEHSPTTPARLHAAGVPFAFYTGGLSDPAQARAGVKRAVDAGLPADAALRALTLGAAEILGVADRMGSIEEGKIANLILVDGDLLDPAAKVERVVIDGRPFDVFEPTRMAGRNGESRDADGAPAGPVVEMAAVTGPYRDDAATLLRNATVMTVTQGTLEGGDVLIRDGKIAAVGRGLDAPRGAHVVDATGLYITPGIIDAHSHIAADAINEGTVNVSAMVRMKDVIDPEDVAIYRALGGGVTSLNLLHGSANPIGGRSAILKLRWGADAADLIFEAAPKGIKFALGENPKRDRNPDRYPATRMGVLDVIREAFLDTRAYMAEWEAYEEARRRDRNAIPPRRDLKLETLAEILRGERDVHAHSYRADEILQLLRLAEEQGFQIKAFQHVLEGYKVADEIAEHGAGASTFSDWWAYKVEAYDAIPHNAALMTERGVVVSINSDDAEEMRHLNQEAAKTMKWGGLSEAEALELITLNPAIQLGVEDRVGSIEVGKDADLAVFRGHPLSVEGVVQQTYVDGKLYFDRDLDRERQRALEREREALMRKHASPAPSGPTTTTIRDGAEEVTR